MAPAATEPALYAKVADFVRAQMDSGELRPGDPVPTEQDLIDTFGCSRDTVRKALLALQNEGRISAAQGRAGRRVLDFALLTFDMSTSESMKRMKDRLAGTAKDAWVADVAEQQHSAGQRIEVQITKATGDVARLLQLGPGELVVVRRRVRYVDGSPHNRNDTFYPMDIAQGTKLMNPDDIPEGGIAYMANELGIVQDAYTDDVTARMPTPGESEEMGLGLGVPVMVQHRTGYMKGRPVKVTMTVWPAHATRLHWKLPAT